MGTRITDWRAQTIGLELQFPVTRVATFFVAASNAEAAAKSQADWVCGGVADNVEIQEAIDALPASGGKVILSEGTFPLETGIVVARDNVAIIGQGRSTVLLDGGSVGFGIDVTGLQSGLTVAHLDIDGFTIGLAPSGVTNFLGLDVHVRNSTGLAFGGPADFITAGHNIACHAVGNTGNGFGIGAGSNRVHLSGCVSEDNNIGFIFDLCSEITLEGCTARNNASHGFKFENSVARCILIGSVFVGNGGWGVFESSPIGAGNLVQGNQFDDNTSGGVSSDTATVRGNVGHITEKSGTATLVNGQTSIVVTHGLAVTPVAGDVMVTPMESLGAASEFYIDTYTATQFTIHVDADPTQDVDFAWKAVVL